MREISPKFAFDKATNRHTNTKICFSVRRFGEGKICRKFALFCLVRIKKRSFLTSCVFSFVSLNDSSLSVFDFDFFLPISDLI